MKMRFPVIGNIFRQAGWSP